MANPRRASRSYRNDLRVRQAANTRAEIVAALVAELARSHETGSELSLPRVAERAGVAVRTVYHHFPDRASQLAAIAAQLDLTTPLDPNPSSLGDLPAHAARAAYQMLADPARLRVEVMLNRTRKARDQAITRAVAKQCDASTAKLVSAGLASLLAPETALALLDRHKLEPAAAETTIAWMVQVLVDSVRNGDTPAPALRRTRRT